MKRASAGIFCSLLLATALRAGDTVAIAAQQEIQDNYKRLSATFDELQAAQLALQKQVSALASEVGKLRDDISRNNNNASTQEAIRELNKQILKVDESRIADNKRIQEAIEKLGGAIKSLPTAPPSRRIESSNAGTTQGTGPRSSVTGGAAVEDGFDYVIQKDDRLDKIVARYREEKIMVTKNAIMAANPTVDWTKLKIGQHIFIPKPK